MAQRKAEAAWTKRLAQLAAAIEPRACYWTYTSRNAMCLMQCELQQWVVVVTTIQLAADVQLLQPW